MDGKMPWMDSCFYLAKRPVNQVVLTAADGKTNITFFPDDIKAFITTYYAEAQFKSQFIGGRCPYENLKDVPADNATGLWEDAKCFSINPASLTMTLGNQIGLLKKNLIYDPDSNGEVWNQPVYGYQMSYYNVLNHTSGYIDSVKVPIGDLKDKTNAFLNFVLRKASSGTKYVIGVKLTVDFVFENTASHITQNPDRKDSRSYEFVLELDESGNILGGEWTKNNHAIFAWTAQNPNGIGDTQVPTFNGSVTELNSLTKVAVEASSRNTVLKAIAEYLVNKSA
jgi:hypothetical protein